MIFAQLQLRLHNSHFTDPLFELSQIAYEIGQYSTIKYNNLIAQYNLEAQQLCTIYNMSVTNRCVYNFAYVQNINSTIAYSGS